LTPSHDHRILKLSLFALLVLILVYLAGNTLLAWIYAYSLTHPSCNLNPLNLSGFPQPEEHWLATADGISIRAWYYPSQNGAAVLATGGMDGALGQGLPPVGFLLQRGYGVLQIDSRACAKPSTPVTLGGKEVLDLSAGLDFFRARPEVEHIAAYGFSMGAASAVRAAALHAEIAAIVAEGGYFNLGQDFVEADSRQSPLRKLFLYTIAGAYWVQSGLNPRRLSPIDDLPRLSPRPVLLIYGEKEASSGRARAQYAAANEPKTLWIVPGGNHGTNYSIAPEEYERRVLRFFDHYLLGKEEQEKP
jgi:uncharacterized protein